ncbi:carbon-nitrogen hydrolase family protein [Ktedonosporobacter rubrisoli]|uniref:Carbon-nitrogen hydrolase family protein n=2 Tax=Ktedonosporobacter rubrisoli TaxID=2509675 RepID=A0A4P6K573_KTERU|nr:carbon-nitrogen hydrolase family protein [Ktedonosporobacter rubrisoli]
MQVTVALLQMTGHANDQAANLRKGEAFCRQARQMGADIALFPEMWNIGYTAGYPHDSDGGDIWRAPQAWTQSPAKIGGVEPSARAQWLSQAIGRDDPFITHFRQLARELQMAIAISYLEKWQGGPRNSVSLIDRHGEIIMTYAKIHTCDFDEPEWFLTPGDDFFVSSLDTSAGEVKIGTMICYDREFPESARILMLKGAELILTPNACPLESLRIEQFRMRAYENMVGVAMANYAAPQENGHSVAFDPCTFEDGGLRDTLIIEAGEHEGIFLAPFDLDKLRAYRARETWGNAFRKPHRYGLLTSLEVEEPFIRTNAQGERYDRQKR